MDFKGLKRDILGGLITSVIMLLLIYPGFAWRIIMPVVGPWYADRIYNHAALGDRDDYGFLMVLALALASTLARLFFIIRRGPKDNIGRIVHATWKVMVVISILCAYGVYWLSSGSKLMTASFTQRLTVLAPAINDTEYKALKARWASMQGKADYDALVTAMDKRATELGVTLPPVRKP
jgi:hypothetical protein